MGFESRQFSLDSMPSSAQRLTFHVSTGFPLVPGLGGDGNAVISQLFKIGFGAFPLT